MNYIVFDLEWNQSNTGREETRKDFPFEIIEIGAVKLDFSGKLIDRFHELIRPGIYEQMNYITEKLVHIKMEELQDKRSFLEVGADFLSWCGSDCIFCTWGSLDLVELQRNLEFYEMQPLEEGPFPYLDVQKLFALTYEDRRTRRALEYAIDYLGIIKDVPFHRAYSDAYYTAKIFSNLLLKNPDIVKNISYDVYHPPKTRKDEIRIVFDDYAKYISRVFPDKKEALEDKEVCSSKCYLCHKNLRKKIKWFTANNRHYYCVAYCEKHGYVKCKVRIMKASEGGVFVVKTTRFIEEDQKNILAKKREHVKELKKRRGL